MIIHSDDYVEYCRETAAHLKDITPTAYLEGRYAQELKTFNSRNSNSRTGAIKTWSQLVANSDKDHLRGMRRLLSRSAKKRSSSVRRLSGN